MNAADILKYGHQTVVRAIDGLAETDWETPGACGIWSVKDIIAHLASYEHLLVEILAGFLGGGPTPYLTQFGETGDTFNDVQVVARREKTVQDVLVEYNDMQGQTMALVAQIPVETLRETGTIPWYGMEYALDDLIVYMYYGHKREHSAQIAVFRDHLAR
jgi:DinB family protein